MDELIEARIRRGLTRDGRFTQTVDELTIDPGEWRVLARRVAKSLKRPFETWEWDETVGVAFTDWPATEAERRRTIQRVRNMMDGIDPS